MWKLCQHKASKMKVSLQENCLMNPDKSSNCRLPKDNNQLNPVSISSNRMSANDDSCAINELLEGRMYLTVFLPPDLVWTKGSQDNDKIRINIERRTPMMDILVNIATQLKFNASKYRISVEGHNFQASTPIGLLDVNKVYIVPKPVKPSFRSTDPSCERTLPQSMPSPSIIYPIPCKQSSTISTLSANSSANTSTSSLSNHSSSHQGLLFISNVPFKPTFRVQVNLPRNQLMALRVSPESTINQIKSRICDEKELDPSKYQLTGKNGRETVILDPVKCLSDYGINEVTLIPANRLVKVQMDQSTSHPVDNPSRNHNSSVNHNGDESNKVTKKRPAPRPPPPPPPPVPTLRVPEGSEFEVKSDSPECDERNSPNGMNHLQQQEPESDSSGYHESMISSESIKSSSDAISQPKSQNKLSDKENARKGIIKKRKAPLPPNWRDNKRDSVQSIDCLSDVTVPLSSLPDMNRQNDYRHKDESDSNTRIFHPEDGSSSIEPSQSDDVADNREGSDTVPNLDSGSCSLDPLDKDKGNDGIASAPESAIMSDSAIGNSIVEETEIELDQPKSFNQHINRGLSMEPKSHSPTPSYPHDGCNRNSDQMIGLFGAAQLINQKTSNCSGGPDKPSNPSSNSHPSVSEGHSLHRSDKQCPEMEEDSVDSIGEKEQFIELCTNPEEKLDSIESNDSIPHEAPIEVLVRKFEPIIRLNLDDYDDLKESHEKPLSQSSNEMTLVDDLKVDGGFGPSLKPSDVNQNKKEPSMGRPPTIDSSLETIENDRETNCSHDDDEMKINFGNEKRFDCLFEQGVGTRSPRSSEKNNESEDKDKDKDKQEDGNNDESLSTKFVRDLCRPRTRLTNFRIGSYRESDNLDIYQDNAIGTQSRPESLNIDEGKPFIVTASLKNLSSSACNEFGHNTQSKSSSNDRISMINPKPFALNRLASWSGTDTKSFRQAYSNVSNCIGNRQTIAEKAEKIEKVLRRNKQSNKVFGLSANENPDHGLFRASSQDISSRTVATQNPIGYGCVSRIEINGDSTKVSISVPTKGINNEDEESPIQVTTFVKSDPSDDKIGIHRDQTEKKIRFNEREMNTKLEIINTVKPQSKVRTNKTESINPRCVSLPSKPTIVQGTMSKVPLPPISSFNPPPPPPPPPQPSRIPNKISSSIKLNRNKVSGTQMSASIVPNFKPIPFGKGPSSSGQNFHDALLNEIRACGGRKALRKVQNNVGPNRIVYHTNRRN